MPPKTITAKDGTVLDAGVVNLSKAIRARESKGDYNAVGDAGTSKGAYQWQPGNFENGARKYGLDPKDFSPINQDKVAYYQVKELKDKGYSPEQVAAAWNAGEGKIKNDAWKSNVGTTTINGQQIRYDTPGYVNSVIQEFNNIKGGYNPTPFSGGTAHAAAPGSFDLTGGAQVQQPKREEAPTTLLPNLGEIGTDLKEGLKKRVADISTGAQTTTKGGIHMGSGAIQVLGGIAGGVGDIANAGLQIIPGVQAAEKYLGQAVRGGLNTKTGQDVMRAFGEFAEKNPELAKTIGAGVNVVAAIPILRGLGMVKSAAGDATTAALRSKVEKNAREEITESLTSRPASAVARAQKRGADPIEFMIKEPTYMPDVVPNPSGGFMYSSKRGLSELERSLEADEAALQGMLDQAIKKNVMVSITEARKKVLDDIKLEYPLSTNYLPATRGVNEVFDSIKASSGGRDMISLNELNAIKRDVRNAVFDVKGDVRGSVSADIKYNIGQSLMRQIEQVAEKAGAKGVRKLNKQMGTKIEATKVLKAMDESKLKTKGGLAREAAVDVAGFAGEAVGGAFGSPFAGTLASRGLTGSLLRRAPRSAVSKLSRYKRPTTSLRKGLLKIGKGLGLQQTTQDPTK